MQAKTAERELKWQNSLGDFWARRPFEPGGPLGLEALGAWRCFGPGGPPGLSLLPTISITIISGRSDAERCFNPFSTFCFFAYEIFLKKIHTSQTDSPIQFFLGQNV